MRYTTECPLEILQDVSGYCVCIWTLFATVHIPDIHEQFDFVCYITEVLPRHEFMTAERIKSEHLPSRM